MRKIPLQSIGYGFIPPEYLEEGRDEYTFRFQQNPREYRSLETEEIEQLIRNGNHSSKWTNVLVSENFSADLIHNCHFYGLVRLGNLNREALLFHDIQYPVGLYNSSFYSCDIGDSPAIHRVSHLSHYIIGEQVILQNIGELVTTNHAKFGVGCVKEGERESVRISLEVGNENGRRKILPFEGMTCGDAWLWSTLRADPTLQKNFKAMTERELDSRRGYYGTIGSYSVIKESGTIKDVKMGEHGYIKGANKLKNLTIKSSYENPSQVGEGVEMVNGIMGYGCHAFYGIKAVRFIMKDHSQLKYGARLINSLLGENSTISCCEVLNSLIYPGHEQHHNSSFLCASRIQGQSNIAANVTAGSNHNSRANDGELFAKRGFWPGLSSSFKLPSSFSSFALIVKGSYPYELNLPLPFTMVSNRERENELSLYPGFWFLHNLYALGRNSWKMILRDRRSEPRLHLEFEYLAPDTVEEMWEALHLLRKWAKESLSLESEQESDELLKREKNPPILGSGVEASSRLCRIHNGGQGYQTFLRLIRYYVAKVLAQAHLRDPAELERVLKSHPTREKKWHNLGGLLVPETTYTSLLDEIRSGRLSWGDLHQRYHELSDAYPSSQLYHGVSLFEELFSKESKEAQLEWLDEAMETSQWLDREVFKSREKDYLSEKTMITFDSKREQEEVLGRLEENEFILYHREKTAQEVLHLKSLKEWWNGR